jgi:hypothetical protein
VNVNLCNGVLTVLPAGFMFPKMSYEQLIRNWLLGIPGQKIVPYHRITAPMVKHLKNGNDLRCQMQAFMKFIEMYAKVENVWVTEDKWDHGKVTHLWNAINHKHIFGKYYEISERNRCESLSWCTVYSKLKKKGVYKRSHNECVSDEQWNDSIHNPQFMQLHTSGTSSSN